MYTLGNQPDQQQTMYWLRWLNQKLQAESKTEFALEEIQPKWLDKNAQKWFYRIGLGLMLGLTIGMIYLLIGLVIGGLMFGLMVGLMLGLALGLMSGLLIGATAVISLALLSGLGNEIKPVEAITKWSWEKAKKRIGLALWTGLGTGVSIVVHSGEFVSGLVVGLIMLLISILIIGFSGSENKSRTIPNQLIWESARNTVIFTFIGALFGGIGTVLLQLITQHSVEPISVMMAASIFGIGLGMFWGGMTCIQHFVLRLVLWQSGAIPWNYARFLNYCTEQGFLERKGDRYRFTNDLLQSDFAKM
ncbi:hypothetical protein [Coleofasciculus sp. H7-2]|uniref:hypothetical protein n=1 Tax=Coleofasciculus sp. H7-2 TaxID=3351545 RepID=UPI0036708355